MNQRYPGVVIGIVKSQPDDQGRVELEFPWMGGARSAPAHVAAPMAGKNRGMFFMPEIDDLVLVAFDHGEFAHPYIVGFFWDGGHTPPETNHRNRVIKTPGGHELRFEDSDGAKKVIIKSSRGHQIVLDDTPAGQTITVMTKGMLSLVMDDKDASIQLHGGGRILALRAGQIQIS